MNAGMTGRLAVGEKNAAAMVDMPVRDFLDLVDAGVFPQPTEIGEHKRWLVADIEAILTGEAARPKEGFVIAI